MLIGLIGEGGVGGLIRLVFFAYNNKYWRYRHADMLAWEQGGRSPPQPQIASPQCSPEGWQQWGGSGPPPWGRLRAGLGVRAWCCCPRNAA